MTQYTIVYRICQLKYWLNWNGNRLNDFAMSHNVSSMTDVAMILNDTLKVSDFFSIIFWKC